MSTPPPMPYPPSGPTGPVVPAAAHAAAAPRASRLPWFLVAVLAVVALVLGGLLVLRPAGGSDDSRGFATPEEAIEYVTERVAAGDAEGALAAWAGQNQAENIDVVATLERLRSFLAFRATVAPADEGFFSGLSASSRAGAAADETFVMVLGLLLPEVDPRTAVVLDDDLSAQDVASALDATRLAGLRPARIEVVDGPEAHQENQARSAELVGADERREYLVLYEWDGASYVGGVTLLRYGQDWQVETLASALAGTPIGLVEPASEADFEARLASLPS